MKKFLFLILFLAISLFLPQIALAQTYPYVIQDFSSDITVNQDSSLTVVETIKVYFYEQRHGIYRDIPVVYRTAEKTINSKLQVKSVGDENGNRVDKKISWEGDSIRIRIGDENKLVQGPKTYVVTYRVRNIIQKYEDHDELYWNAVGSGWDTVVEKARAHVTSSYADINNVKCYAGPVGTTAPNCLSENSNYQADFLSNVSLGRNKDLTIVLALDKNNQLDFTTSFGDFIYDNWGYPFAVLPFLVMLWFWYKKGRDVRFIGDNVWYKPDKAKQENVPVFGKREYLPLAYSPIDGLTPSEVGTLLDERIDIHDVVAEIVELGRLGFLKIERLDKKFRKDDYLITKIKKSPDDLLDFQKYLLEKIFSHGDKDNIVKLSDLKNNFYKNLDTFKDKLYSRMANQGYFPSRPDHVRTKWIVISVVFSGILFALEIVFSINTGNFLPLFLLVPFAIFAIFFSFAMPRKTAKGYALYRQIKGLKFYLGKGKWREEINEKHLFLRDMLPLAISLGVVNKLARDMQDLGVKPPSYFNAHTAVWASSFNSFNSSAGSSLIAGSSSSGSWSGGSGFSGGGGGGFGGGGGGSW